jgi:hypothetical protein
MMTGLYTSHRYVLGARCERGHGGNRRYIWWRGDAYATCAGCHTFIGTESLPRFQNRREAIAADRAFVARWPEDPASAVLAGRRI